MSKDRNKQDQPLLFPCLIITAKGKIYSVGACVCTSLCPAGPVGASQCHRGCGVLSLTSTVCEAIEGIALVAGALKGARVVDARVVARPLEGALVDVCKVQREVSEPLWGANRAQQLQGCADLCELSRFLQSTSWNIMK